jgi:hydroxypyruvate isomerase
MRIKQSMCYSLYQPEGMGVDEFFGIVADTGFAAVELWHRPADFEDVVTTANKHQLVVASMIGHADLPDGLNKTENHDRIEAELRESIDIAAACGIGGLICFSGNRNEGQSDEQGAEVCVAGLKRIVGYAEEKGVNLNMELLNSRVDHAGYQCDRTAWGVAVCKAVGSPRAKLLFDVYHMQIMEGDLIRTIQDNIEYIGHFHVAGNPGRHEMDDSQEINYGAVCRAIVETGFENYVGHELVPTGDKLEAMRQSFAICDQG